MYYYYHPHYNMKKLLILDSSKSHLIKLIFKGRREKNYLTFKIHFTIKVEYI